MPFQLRVPGLIAAFLFGPLLLLAQTYTVAEVSVSGNNRTKDFAIRRVMTFEKGSKIDADKLEKIRQRNHDNIYNLAIFNKVTVKDSVVGESIYFDVIVRERWYIFPISYVAFEERTFNEWWEDKDLDRLVYGLGAQWKNVTGRAEDFYFYGQLGYSRRFSIFYNKPFFIPAWKLDAEFSYLHINRKEIGYGTEEGVLQLARLQNEQMQTAHIATVAFKKRLSPRKYVKVGINYQWFLPNDSVRFFNDRYLTTSQGVEKYPSVFLRYVDDQRDIKSFPLKGYRINAFARQSGFPFASTTQFLKARLYVSHHIPLGGKRFNFAWGMQNFALLGYKVPFFDKNLLGFTNYIRGYERYVIDGSYINITKAEFKFAVVPRQIVHMKQIPFKRFQDFPVGLYLSLFADAGTVIDKTFSNQDQFLKNRLLTGVGAGLNFITFYDILLRFEYTINHLGQGGYFISTQVSIR